MLSPNFRDRNPIRPLSGMNYALLTFGENQERTNQNSAHSPIADKYFLGDVAVNRKQCYENLLKAYPDVVDLITFREMLGGISDCAARRLMKKNRVKHFYISNAYLIPKVWLIQYLSSKKYEEDKIRYRVQI